MLKKRKVREEGGQNLFVEQNHRPQLLYTENDRPILEAAWEDCFFACAHICPAHGTAQFR